jgi:hypothetical protein
LWIFTTLTKKVRAFLSFYRKKEKNTFQCEENLYIGKITLYPIEISTIWQSGA